MMTIGTSPQVLTEMLFYHTHSFYRNQKTFDEILVFTTKEGKIEIIKNLFERNILNKMEKELKINSGGYNFSKKDIITIKDTKGVEINDARLSSDNMNSMNVIFDVMKKYTNDNTCDITASIAGGRKSMSAMMSLSFQMLGRENDELLHIIAPNEKMYDGLLNNDPNKWYYPKNPKNKDEQLDVSIVPTLKIGNFLPISNEGSFEQILHKYQNFLIDKAPLESLTIKYNIFSSGDESFKIQPMYASYLRYFIKNRINANCLESCDGCEECFVSFEDIMFASQNEILNEHEEISGDNNQHYLLKKEKILQYDPKNTSLSELELGELGLKARNRQDISRLRKAYNKINISPKFKDTLMIRDKRIDGTKYIGLIIQNKEKVVFDD